MISSWATKYWVLHVSQRRDPTLLQGVICGRSETDAAYSIDLKNRCRWIIIIWLLHNLVEASFDLFRYLLLGDQLKPWELHPLVSYVDKIECGQNCSLLTLVCVDCSGTWGTTLVLMQAMGHRSDLSSTVSTQSFPDAIFTEPIIELETILRCQLYSVVQYLNFWRNTCICTLQPETCTHRCLNICMLYHCMLSFVIILRYTWIILRKYRHVWYLQVHGSACLHNGSTRGWHQEFSLVWHSSNSMRRHIMWAHSATGNRAWFHCAVQF